MSGGDDRLCACRLWSASHAATTKRPKCEFPVPVAPGARLGPHGHTPLLRARPLVPVPTRTVNRRDHASAEVSPCVTRTFVQHFIRLIQNQHLDGPCPQTPATDHIYNQVQEELDRRVRGRSGHSRDLPPLPTSDPAQTGNAGNGARPSLTKHTPRRAGHDVLPVVQLPDVLPHVGAPDAGVALHVHVVAEREQALAEHRSFPCTWHDPYALFMPLSPPQTEPASPPRSPLLFLWKLSRMGIEVSFIGFSVQTQYVLVTEKSGNI